MNEKRLPLSEIGGSTIAVAAAVLIFGLVRLNTADQAPYQFGGHQTADEFQKSLKEGSSIPHIRFEDYEGRNSPPAGQIVLPPRDNEISPIGRPHGGPPKQDWQNRKSTWPYDQ
jgi:hypothetical protein